MTSLLPLSLEEARTLSLNVCIIDVLLRNLMTFAMSCYSKIAWGVATRKSLSEIDLSVGLVGRRLANPTLLGSGVAGESVESLLSAIEAGAEGGASPYPWPKPRGGGPCPQLSPPLSGPPHHRGPPPPPLAGPPHRPPP